MKKVRPKIQMVFQDPYSSLNGRMTVRQLIAEPLLVNKICKNRAEVDKKVDEMMETVGLARRLDMAFIPTSWTAAPPENRHRPGSDPESGVCGL